MNRDNITDTYNIMAEITPESTTRAILYGVVSLAPEIALYFCVGVNNLMRDTMFFNLEANGKL